VIYRGFPSKLHHDVPHWVESSALFHIRIAVNRDKRKLPLISAPLAKALLDSAKFYEVRQRWYITLFLLMRRLALGHPFDKVERALRRSIIK